MLRRGAKRVLEVEPRGSTIRKTFLDDGAAGYSAAALEFDRLRRFRAALIDVEGVACPRPIELVAGPPPALRMERMPGVPLLGILRSRGLGPELRSTVARRAALALTSYIEALAEPYLDFQFDNMLYDAEGDTVTFVDLGMPDGGRDPVHPPLEASLGNLIGSTVYQSARPKWLLARRQHREATALCVAIVSQFAAAVSVRDLRAVSADAYARNAFRRGPTRRLWYETVGRLVAAPVRVLGTTFAPPAAPAG